MTQADAGNRETQAVPAIEVGRDKADLKAVRESIGIMQADLAHEMNVTVRTIKRWEQIGWEEPPARLWDLLEDMVGDHNRAVEVMVRQAEEAALADAQAQGEQGGDVAGSREPKTIYLVYYKNQKHYDCFPHQRGTSHNWGNAIARRAADILRLRGYRVLFYYPETARDISDTDED